MPLGRLPVALIAIAAAALAACTSVQQGLVERGYPPAYAEGYDHGCASGKAAAGDLFEQAQKDRSATRATASMPRAGTPATRNAWPRCARW